MMDVKHKILIGAFLFSAVVNLIIGIVNREVAHLVTATVMVFLADRQIMAAQIEILMNQSLESLERDTEILMIIKAILGGKNNE